MSAVVLLFSVAFVAGGTCALAVLASAAIYCLGEFGVVDAVAAERLGKIAMGVALLAAVVFMVAFWAAATTGGYQILAVSGVLA
ncbi:MAG: hypothetical protein AAF737_04905 [Pseudomonadota bacterium]